MRDPWFERAEDGSWVFTVSGKDEDPHNFLVPELDLAFGVAPSYFRDHLVKIVVGYDGDCEFHFDDGSTPSVSSAFLKDSYTFLELINVCCVGMLIKLSESQHSPPTEVVSWFDRYMSYRQP